VEHRADHRRPATDGGTVKILCVYGALLLAASTARAQAYDAAGLRAAAQLELAAPVWHDPLTPIPLAQNEPAKIWLIGGAAAVVVGAVVGGDGGTILLVGGLGAVGYGVYLASR
jgi:hypothetical protein